MSLDLRLAVVGSEASVKSEAVAGIVAVADEEQTISDTEADEMEEHLRGLGYGWGSGVIS